MRVIIFTTLLLFPVLLHAQYKKEVYTTASGYKLPYRILYPENYDPQRSYPLVVFLHGVLEKGNDNEQQLANGGALFLNEQNRKNFPAIVIFPQCSVDSYWASVDIDQNKLPIQITFHYEEPPTDAMNACIELIGKFTKEKKADKKKVYILGLSMGGMGTLEAISRYPELFAAAVPICGAGDTSYCHRYAGRTALWLFHGEEDKGMDPEQSRVIVNKLRSLGDFVKYTEYPGVGHNSWDKALAEPELLPWLFRQKIRKKVFSNWFVARK